jgi:rubrerythrin
MAELDAINLYEQLANMTEDENIRTILLDVAREEKTHVGEFMALLLNLDEEQVEELEAGKEEVEELLEEEEE